MDLISILNTAFIICLSGAILFFVISVVLFFVFDIRTIFMIRSGRAQAKTVKEMQEANSSTGRLRVGKTTQTSGLGKDKATGKLGKSTGKLGKNTGKLPKKPVIQPPQSEVQQADFQQPEDYYMANESKTAPLSDPAAPAFAGDFDDASETTILSPESETSVLSRMDDAAYAASSGYSAQTAIYFDVIKKIIVRDTDEVIR